MDSYGVKNKNEGHRSSLETNTKINLPNCGHVLLIPKMTY